jgi:hypothetical protein
MRLDRTSLEPAAMPSNALPNTPWIAIVRQIAREEAEAALARAAAEEAALWMEVLGDYPRKLPKKRVP